MKKVFALLLALLLAGALMSCAPAPESESAVPSVQAEAPAQAQPSESEESSVPEDAPRSGMLYVVSDEEIASSVRAYHVADDSFQQPDLVPYKVVDLSDLASYHEFVDSYQTPSRIVFMTDTPVTDFRYLRIETSFMEDMFCMGVEETLWQLDVLTPEEPFVVNWLSIGDIGMFRGFSYVDEDGVTKYFGFNLSGYDGSISLTEFKPEERN